MSATLLSALVSLGFSLVSLADPALLVPGAASSQTAPFAAYALSRSGVIALGAVFALLRRSVTVLRTIGWMAGGVQALDVLVGIMQGDLAKAAGPALLAAFSVYALVRLKDASGQF